MTMAADAVGDPLGQGSGPDALATVLVELHRQGAADADLLGLWFLEGLIERLPQQPPPVAAHIEAAAWDGVKRLRERLAQRPPTVPQGKGAVTPPARPLAALVAQLKRPHASHSADPAISSPDPAPAPLERFRDTWRKVDAVGQVDRALARAPANAGPLNPQRLMVQALDRLRQLSPDYLARLMTQLDALAWLDADQPDQAVAQTPKGAGAGSSKAGGGPRRPGRRRA